MTRRPTTVVMMRQVLKARRMSRIVRAALAASMFLLSAGPVLGQRLPAGVVPLHYALQFTPNLQAETFRGRAAIDVTVSSATSAVTFHAAGSSSRGHRSKQTDLE
jgi:hypothetical protein